LLPDDAIKRRLELHKENKIQESNEIDIAEDE